MKIIAVEKKGLLSDFRDWGISTEYAEFFISKCEDDGKSVALRSFVFNDTIQLDNPIQWLSACAAFWCRAYRETESGLEQIEALSAIRALYFAAGFLGASPVVAMIRAWWSNSYELHRMTAPNISLAQPGGFRSTLLNTSFLQH